MDGNTKTTFEMKLGKHLIARFGKLSRWKQRVLIEDLECALENRLKVLERA